MTPEEQRIAIAEACGWASYVDAEGAIGEPGLSRSFVVWIGPNDGNYHSSPPDYLNDLNAMHEAWTVGIKDAGEDEAFCRQLRLIACPDQCECSECSYVINATAAQRAGAFLRTIGKWRA